MIQMIIIFYIIVWAVLIVLFFSIIIGVPPLPTHKKQARLMVEMAELKPGMLAIDLGSGTGRILWLAAKTGARVIGYELNPFLFFWTKIAIKIKKLSGQVEIRCKNLYKADVSQADAVFCFLFPEPMVKLQDKFARELKPGARVLSYAFRMPKYEPAEKKEGIFYYQF